MTDTELMKLAEKAREKSYSPYSHFAVGAALLTKSGKVYLGCNVENSAFTPTVCAERVALFKAVSEGEREFAAIAVTGAKEKGYPRFCSPCGVCRQALSEFFAPDCKVLLGNAQNVEAFPFGDLLPFTFGQNDLK